jgi:hypothetical protein
MTRLFEALDFTPGYQYCVTVKSKPDDEMGEWLIENATGLWVRDLDLDVENDFGTETFHFDNDKDCVAFTLKFG